MSQFWKAWQKRKETLQEKALHHHADRSMESVSDIELSLDVDENITMIEKELGKCDDLVVRRFRDKRDTDCAIVFLDGMVDRNIISEFIIVYMSDPKIPDDLPASNELESTDGLRQVIRNILSGSAVLMRNGDNKAYLNNTRGWDR